jgi:thiamine biosynthesis lipoprotein
MATRFEIVLHGEDSSTLRAAGEEALDEIDRLEAQLSLYRLSSEVAHLNARAHEQPVRVTPELFRLLARATKLSEETHGAFDITIAPLVRCWGFMGGTGSMPRSESIAEARARVGMHLLELNEDAFTVHFQRAGVMLDFGAIGKGYAIERAAEIVARSGRHQRIDSRRHQYGLRHRPFARPVQMENRDHVAAKRKGSATAGPRRIGDEALSVSAVWGKSFQSGAKTYGHIIDPRRARRRKCRARRCHYALGDGQRCALDSPAHRARIDGIVCGVSP